MDREEYKLDKRTTDKNYKEINNHHKIIGQEYISKDKKRQTKDNNKLITKYNISNTINYKIYTETKN